MYHSVDLNHYETQAQSLKLSFTNFDSGHRELFVFYYWKLLKGSRFWYRLYQVLVGSPRSKRFRLVSGQKRQWKIFGFNRARNETRTKEWKSGEGEGEGKKGFLLLSSPPPPRSFACAISRAVSDSCSSFFAAKPHRNTCYACYSVWSPGVRVGRYSQ